jgi:hypothetical protein
MNVKAVNKFSNQKKATAVYTAAMEALPVLLFSRIKNAANDYIK